MIFRVSQTEMWHRPYWVEAETLDEAQEKYSDFVLWGKRDGITVGDPEFIDDMDDVSWFKDDTNEPL